jgi:hypothetical protein
MVVENLPDFAGKLVVLYVSHPPRAIQDGIVMEYASFQSQGDRLFVVGRVPELYGREDEWASNLQAGVAWDTVCHYLIFKSREEYLARVGTGQPTLLQRIMGH